MNALRGRWENFFSSEQVCVVRLDNREDLIKKLVYIAMNPVKAGLVTKAEDWHGAHGYPAFLDGTPLQATRPKHFLAEDGTMPEEIELYMTVPPELGDRDELVAEVRARVADAERAEAKRREARGRGVLGRDGVLRQSWRDSPLSREPRRGLRPTFVASTLWALVEAAQRKREFTVAYQQARKERLLGKDVVFPFGTYWLKRFVNTGSFVLLGGVEQPAHHPDVQATGNDSTDDRDIGVPVNADLRTAAQARSPRGRPSAGDLR